MTGKLSLISRISRLTASFRMAGLSEGTARRYAQQSADFWRPATKAELVKRGLSTKSERLVPASAKRISTKTPFLTRSQHVELRTGLTPKQLAAEHQFGARQYSSQARREAAAKVRAKTAERQRQRAAYDGAATRDIRRFKELQRRKRAGEILLDDDFDFMMQFGADHVNHEHDFLHEPFENSPATRRKRQFKRSKPRASARTRVVRAPTAGQQRLPRQTRGDNER